MPVLFWLRRVILILVGIGLLITVQPCSALPPSDGSVLLAWNPSISTNIVGYNIYYGTPSDVYTNITFVSGSTVTNVTVTNLVEGTTYYFAATSVDSFGGESPFSDEVSYSVPILITNAQPTLNVLSNVVINENAPPQSVALTGISSGATNEIQTLTVTASSSKTGLIPNPTVTYTSPNASGSLTFAPVANTPGITTISVSVNDGGPYNNIITRTFTVTVQPPDVTPPILSFVSPTFNQQWSNATFTVTGKAADNVAVGTVLYSLNSGPWLNATTANGWTNWTGSLNLTPGTNTVQAYAVDTSGNHSTTNSVSFEYVVLMPVTLQIYSQGLPNPNSGSLSPNYTNGTRLVLNQNYSLTAMPAAGFAFTNWSDGSGKMLTNGPTLRFTMAPSLSLRANFKDGIAPTVSIVSPTFNQQWSNATFTVTGKAADNVAVSTVLYSLNSGPWLNATTANGWTNWTGSLNLTPGTNTVQAYAVDSSGNHSTTNSVSFEYVVLMPVTLQIYSQGLPNPNSGSLSPNYTNGTRLVLNQNYSLTAMPAAGFAFTNWSDGSGKMLTNGPTLRFTMAPSLSLRANFKDGIAPTLSIVSPTFNQQWSNATFTVTGKAADNVAVSTVLYSLNSGPWLNATTANGWTNWTGSLNLTPGTNTVQAYAVDSSGNHSTTNSVSFEYVVLMPVTVQSYGQGLPNPKSGSLSPNYTNGTRLAINESYSVTAMPAANFAFANWTDGSGKMIISGATLRFTMAPSLSLRANFKDGVAPTVSIVSPKFNQQWSNATFTVTGKAGDNIAVGNVLYSLNSGPWLNATTANGWTNWTGSLTLTPGTNTVQAYAVDTSGNHSATNTVSFEYVVLMPVAVQVYGLGVPNPKSGSLSPNYTNGTRLAINEDYSITATPAAGFAFTNWTDGSGKVLTNGHILRFIMAPSLSLRANFRDGAAPTVSIVSPKFNQQWSNATFTVTGKAGDNIAVGNVLYSLNSGPWTNATTANSWTNWTGSLNLTPGTNTVQAYAVDSSGNRSTTNTIRFEYVVLMPVTAQVYGLGVLNPKWGSLSPNFSSGKSLPVNEKSKVTARASHGFAFTNWTDGSGKVLTNGHTLQFIMTTNLALHANFVDTTRPTLSIVTPKTRQKLTNGIIVADGRATDNAAVQAVYYSLNGSAWSAAVLATNSSQWSATLILTPGTNTVLAYALDTSGNASTTHSVTFEYQTAAQPQIVAQASAALAEEQTAPAILEALAAPANGQFALSITGTAGQTYVLQVSTDLLNWSSVATNQSPFTFVDTDAAKYPQRFYRSISLP